MLSTYTSASRCLFPLTFKSSNHVPIPRSFFLIIFFIIAFSENSLAAPAREDTEIIPMLECVKWVPDEYMYEATFGYNNPSKTDVTIPPENSTLSCAGEIIAGNQPTTFKPGRVFAAFSVKFPCSELTWTVTGPSGKPMSVTANGSSTACATSGNILPNISTPFKSANKIGSELSILAELPGTAIGTITSDNVYQIEEFNGVKYVFISLFAIDGKLATLLSDLNALGLKQPEVAGLRVTGWLPIKSLAPLNENQNLNLAMPVFTPVFSGGAVTSQGDKAQRTDLTRLGFNVQGQGIKIGVLSDSYNARLGNEAALDVKQADLPGPENPINQTPVQVLKDLPESSGLGTDEGRAMLQIIHDVAPKASLAFRTGIDGPIDLAQGIRELQSAGCNIIVDDISYIDEEFFSDGLVAKAIDEVVGKGVTYFSAAGNFGELSYQGTFTPITTADGKIAHNFGGGDKVQRLFLPAGDYTLSMQWESKQGQDLDFYLTDDNGNIIIGYNRFSTYPLEAMAFKVTEGGAVANIMVVNASATIVDGTIFKYIIFRGNAAIGEYRSGVSTVAGHANAAGAIAVGAVLYQNTPAYNVNPPSIASFSSRGGTPILRSSTGATVNILREKPDFAAPNGVNTTVDLGGINFDGDAFPNFFGTSAAAPHAAAAAALLIEAAKKYKNTTLSPAAVQDLLRSTALDMGAAGRDNASGYGYIRPDAAISTFATPTPIVESLTTTAGTATGKPLIVNGHYFKENTSQIKFAGTLIPTTYISETQLQATIPIYTGNPSISVCNPPTSTSGLDGGCSKPLYLFPKTVVTIKADSFTKRYGDAMPTLSVNITNAPAGFTSDKIQLTTLATDLSNVGAYVITPSLVAGTDISGLLDQYEFVYENGILLIEKIALEIKANDLAIADGDPLTGFTYTYSFPTPINNAPDRITLLLNNLQQAHKAQQTNTVALVTESTLLNIDAIRNRSFLISAAAEINAAYLMNGSRLINVSSSLLNELAADELNATRLLNAAFLMNAARVINGSRLMNGSRLINASHVMNSNTIGEGNNEKAILILHETDEVLNTIYSINLVTGYTLGEHLWSPATLLSNNFNVTYGEPGNLYVNPIGTGVKAVKPFLECVQPSSTPGKYVAHFYYDNPNSVTVGLPSGSENKLVYADGKPAPTCFVNGSSIPTRFAPGRNIYAFSVEFDGTKLIWDLTSFQGTKKTSIASSASSTSSKCRKEYAIKLCGTEAQRISLATGVQGIEDDIAVYPNPTEGNLNIDLSSISSTAVSVTVYDMLGRVCVQAGKVEPGSRNEVNLANLSNGLYLVQIKYGDKLKQVRIVKQ